MVRYTKLEATDDPAYLDWVEATVVGVEEAISTKQSYVVKIDNWFGKRWLGFSAKALGALGVRNTKLTLPPFIPTRVVSQRRLFEGDAPPGPRKRLHVWQRSGETLQRYTEIILQGSNAFWYSGRTASNDRGSFMAYVSTPDGHWPWYVSLRRDETWRVVECVGIGVPELETFTRRGIEELRGADGRPQLRADKGGEVDSNSIMASIRVGFFEDFKGADTLLLDVDHEGLKALIAWLRTASSSSRKTPINHCPGAVVQSGLHVNLSREPNDRGLVRTAGRVRLAAVRGGMGRGHREVGSHGRRRLSSVSRGPTDDVQVMASIGEYGDSWWGRHGG